MFDARFPGQFLDAETGLFHNGFRDYNATTGRYIESDPLGLEDGWNTYGYAEQDSINGTDSYGSRKIVAYVWDGLSEAGHVMLTELDGSPILNQYPHKPALALSGFVWSAKNKAPADRAIPFFNHPERKPSVYVLDIENDAIFDALVGWNIRNDEWRLFPLTGGRYNSTNCVDAASSSLRGGGIDLDDTNLLGIQSPSALRRSLDIEARKPQSRVMKVEMPE